MSKSLKQFLAVSLAAFMMCGAAFAAEPVHFGQIASVTGGDAAYGIAEMEAVKIAVKEINDAGGINVAGEMRPLKVTMYDCRSNNEDAINAARRLIDQDKVCGVVGPDASGICIAIAEVFNRGKVPQIGTLPTNQRVTVDRHGKVRPYTFRINFIDPCQGTSLAVFAAKNMNAKRAAVLHDISSEYSQGLREYFRNKYTELGGTIIAEEGYRADDVDFRAQLTKIKATNPDILIYPIVGKCAELAVKQAREVGLTCPIAGGDGYGDSWWEVAGKALNDTYWVSPMNKSDPALIPFFKKYEESTGTECKEFMDAVTAYDCVYWMKDAVERAGTTDPVKVRDAIEQTKNLKLLHCVLTVDEFHNPKDKEGIILKAQDGGVTYFATVKP